GQRGELGPHAHLDFGWRERDHEMAPGAAPRLRAARDLGRVLYPRLPQRAQRAVDGTDRPQRRRHPDYVDVKRETAARVPDAAIAPAARVTPAIGIAFEAHEMRRDRLSRVRR